MSERNHADYLTYVANPKLQSITVNLLTYMLKKHQDKFDSIACCGMSMLAISPIIANKLDKQLILIRKPHELNTTNHSGRKLEYHQRSNSYIVIDDLIDSGKTIGHVSHIMRCNMPGSTLYGVSTYHGFMDGLYYAEDYDTYKNSECYSNVQQQRTFNLFGHMVSTKCLNSVMTRTMFDKYNPIVKRELEPDILTNSA